MADPAVGAAKRRRPPPPPPPPGFSLAAARLEPISPDTTMHVVGVGEYRGALELHRTAAGVGVTNDVAFEDYLKGIAEMPSGWPAEALRAQAIAARTYVLYVLRSGVAGQAAEVGAQICATEGCQVYSGVAKQRAPNGVHWAAAVDATRGQVLLHQGKPILAKYSSSNGGSSVSGGRSYLKAVADPDDARSPLHQWELSVAYDDIGRALAAPGAIVKVRREGGDVVAAWTGGEMRVPGSEFRAKINATVLPPPGRTRTVPSAIFSLAGDDDARVATLDGRGYGHGIGMSQYGAYGKALKGMKAPAILAAYYGGIKPTALPPDQLPVSVRVALDAGRPEQLVSASGPFRAFDEKGNPVAAVGTGTWRVVPGAKNGLRLLPPPAHMARPRLEVIGIDPPAPTPGQTVAVRFRSTVPALVRMVVRPPGGLDTEILATQPVIGDDVTATLPAATRPGAYLVSIGTDAGGGRTSQLVLMPQVLAPPGSRPASVWVPPGSKSAVSAAGPVKRGGRAGQQARSAR